MLTKTTTKTTKPKPGRAAAIVQRLREPSTMAGLSALMLLAGVPAGVPELAAQALAGVAGLLAVVMPERSAD